MSAITSAQLKGLATSMTEYAARTAASLTAYSQVDLVTETPSPSAEDSTLPQAWSGVIGVENLLTGDGRLIEDGALEWATPLPLRFVLEDIGGHEGAIVVGRILEIWRGDEGKVMASGDFDLGSEAGREAARLVGSEMLNGVSMDLDSVAFEVRVAKELYDEVMGDPQLIEEDELAEKKLETDDEGRVIVAKLSANEEIMVTTSARVRAATLVSVPAFIDAKVFSAEPATRAEDPLVASAAPIEPPKDWFFKSEADGPTALTITDDGQVYGHLATWDTCHIADPSGAGVCVMAPKNSSGYAYFHTGAVKTSEGPLVPTGTIRFHTKHASTRSNASDASAHYDNTGLAGADIHAIDGVHGIWVSGALRPNVTAEQIRELRAAPLSGDWRYVEGKLELVGALSVNVPGFPIPRPQGMVASGAMTALVAAGMVAPEATLEVKQFSSSEEQYLRTLIDRERLHSQRSLAQRVEKAKNRRKIAQLASQRKTELARKKV